MTQSYIKQALLLPFMAFLFVLASADLSPTAALNFDVSAWEAREKLSDDLPPCPDEQMAGRLTRANKARFATTQSAMQDVFKDSIENDKTTPKKYVRGKILDTYCLSVYLDYFGAISGMLSGFSVIEAAVSALIANIIEAAGEYACNYVRNAANEFLNSFCVPLPYLSFSASLPTTSSHSTCTGLSLADAIKVEPSTPLQTTYPLNEVYQSRPMSRWLGTGSTGRF